MSSAALTPLMLRFPYISIYIRYNKIDAFHPTNIQFIEIRSSDNLLVLLHICTRPRDWVSEECAGEARMGHIFHIFAP